MAYGIDAVMDPVEPARHRAVRGGSRSEPECAELPAGDHPVLGRRERRDALIQGGVSNSGRLASVFRHTPEARAHTARGWREICDPWGPVRAESAPL